MLFDYANYFTIKELALKLKWYPEVYWGEIFMPHDTEFAEIIKNIISDVSGIKPQKYGRGWTFHNNGVSISIRTVDGSVCGTRANILICDDAYTYSDLMDCFAPLATISPCDGRYVIRLMDFEHKSFLTEHQLYMKQRRD